MRPLPDLEAQCVYYVTFISQYLNVRKFAHQKSWKEENPTSQATCEKRGADGFRPELVWLDRWRRRRRIDVSNPTTTVVAFVGPTYINRSIDNNKQLLIIFMVVMSWLI